MLQSQIYNVTNMSFNAICEMNLQYSFCFRIEPLNEFYDGDKDNDKENDGFLEV